MLIRMYKSLLFDVLVVCNGIENCDLELNGKELIAITVICAEDRSFFTHKGVSIKSIIRAIYKQHGGASTITMQLVRIITNKYEISFSRKIREMIISLIIESKYTKIEILRSYLHYSYYGYNLNGLDNVINDFFYLKKMTLNDCCFIASLIKRPYPIELSISWANKINKRMNYIKNIYSSIKKENLKKMKEYLQTYK